MRRILPLITLLGCAVLVWMLFSTPASLRGREPPFAGDAVQAALEELRELDCPVNESALPQSLVAGYRKGLLDHAEFLRMALVSEGQLKAEERTGGGAGARLCALAVCPEDEEEMFARALRSLGDAIPDFSFVSISETRTRSVNPHHRDSEQPVNDGSAYLIITAQSGNDKKTFQATLPTYGNRLHTGLVGLVNSILAECGREFRIHPVFWQDDFCLMIYGTQEEADRIWDFLSDA